MDFFGVPFSIATEQYFYCDENNSGTVEGLEWGCY